MTIGVYKISNKINGKFYIGSSTQIEKRWEVHKAGKGNLHLYNSICKYGIENFQFEILERCSQQHLLQVEQKYLSMLNPQYNKSNKATCPSNLGHLWGNQNAKGLVHSEETKAKISSALKGRAFTAEHKAKISAANKGQHSGHKYQLGHEQSDQFKKSNSKRMKRWWKFWKKEGIR